jgi:hypothetical protein
MLTGTSSLFRQSDVAKMAASGTVSSGSWRKGLMRQSIASFFNNREDPEKNDQAVVSESARHEWTETSNSGGVLGGITPTPEGEKNGRRTATTDREGNESLTSLATGPTGDDPMANKHVENGVEYKSMAWWYVLKSCLDTFSHTDRPSGKPEWSWSRKPFPSVSSHSLTPCPRLVSFQD